MQAAQTSDTVGSAASQAIFRAQSPGVPPLGKLISLVFLPFAAGYFLSYLFRTVNALIAPNLTAELGLTASDLGLLTSTYLFAFALAQLPVGILLDRFSARRVQAALLVIATGGSL